MPAEKLSDAKVQELLTQLPTWSLKDGKLHRDFAFSNFAEAFAFMTRAAIVSEKKNHHPEWFNVYNKLCIDLTTHEAKGISQRDFEWAEAVEKIYCSFPQTAPKQSCCG